MKTIRHFSLPTLAIACALSFASHAAAANITFVKATESADTDVVTTGSLVTALDLAGTATTINGVVFAATAPTGGNFTAGNINFNSGAGGSFNVDGTGYGPNSAPFNTLSAGYQSLLESAIWIDTGVATTVTLGSLTIGDQYLIQFWVNDSRGGFTGGRNENFTGGSGAAVNLNFNTGGGAGVTGAVGQFATGTFTADATSQTITVQSPSNNFQLNGVQLRDVTSVPEPSTVALGVLGALGMAGMMRRRPATQS